MTSSRSISPPETQDGYYLLPSTSRCLVRADFDAEQALLGGLLVFPEQYDAIHKHLLPRHFYSMVHAEIYATMGPTIACGAGVDLTADLAEQLKPKHAGVSEILAACLLAHADTSEIELLSRRIRSECRARETRAALADAVCALDMGDDTQTVLDALREPLRRAKL